MEKTRRDFLKSVGVNRPWSRGHAGGSLKRPTGRANRSWWGVRFRGQVPMARMGREE